MYKQAIKGTTDPFTLSKCSNDPATPDPFKATHIREKPTQEMPDKVNQYRPELWDQHNPLEFRSPGKAKYKQKWTTKQAKFQLANRIKPQLG